MRPGSFGDNDDNGDKPFDIIPADTTPIIPSPCVAKIHYWEADNVPSPLETDPDSREAILHKLFDDFRTIPDK
jgi:hypothetical protein